MEYCHSFIPFIVANEARWNQTEYLTFNKIFNYTLSTEIISDTSIMIPEQEHHIFYSTCINFVLFYYTVHTKVIPSHQP